MAYNVAVAIEEEPPHEIYSNLLISPGFTRRAIYDHSITKPNNTDHVVSSNRCVAALSPGESPNVITEDDIADEQDDLNRKSSSQFMRFYRKSCRSSANPSNCNEIKKNEAGDNSKTDGSVCLKSIISSANSIKKESHAPKSSKSPKRPAQAHKKTTKAERRSIARRERERTILREKRIRVMLSSDFSDEYQQIYSRLHRY
mmetsp:Transcript_22298/g.45943  ORF Transcript_22298/g.45943 Transcript_22298/m.45943 type:complete len:201 (+) Transcript_22298:94-696(+)